jgi:hypothetical protein
MFRSATDPIKTARWIVRECESGGWGGLVWFGISSWLIRYVYYFVPKWLADLILISTAPVDHVTPPSKPRIE